MSEIKRESKIKPEPEMKEESEKVSETKELEKEEEFSPEIIEKIMDKVQDIDKKVTAYSGVGGKSILNLHSILQEGLLGWSYYWPYQKSKKFWEENTRKKEGYHEAIQARANAILILC